MARLVLDTNSLIQCIDVEAITTQYGFPCLTGATASACRTKYWKSMKKFWNGKQATPLLCLLSM